MRVVSAHEKMYGPQPKGFWSSREAPNCGASHQFLFAGRRYRVIGEFYDHDRHVHPAGEEWLFLGYSFLPYDDGMSFFVSFDGEQEWHIPMQWREEEQGPILDSLGSYVAEVSSPQARAL